MNTTPSIFCGDLSFFCTDADLSQLFQSIGPVKSAIVRRSRNNDTLHYGFVHMETSEDAFRAFQELNGCKFLGRRLRLNLGSNSLQVKEIDNSFQMHVSFISHNTRMKINEEQLDRIFGQFGTVKDCIIKQYSVSSDPAKQCGYGFVFFSEEASVHLAVRASNLSLIENIHFDGKMSHHTNTKDANASFNDNSKNNNNNIKQVSEVNADTHKSKYQQQSTSASPPTNAMTPHIPSAATVDYYIPDEQRMHANIHGSKVIYFPPNIHPPSSSIPSLPSPPGVTPYSPQPSLATYASSLLSLPPHPLLPHPPIMTTSISTATGTDFNNNTVMIAPTSMFLPSVPVPYVMPSSYPSNYNFYGAVASQVTNNSSLPFTPIPGTSPNPTISNNNRTNSMPIQQLPPPHPASSISPSVMHNLPQMYGAPPSQFHLHHYPQMSPFPPNTMMMLPAQAPTYPISASTTLPPFQQQPVPMSYISAPISMYAPVDAYHHPIQPPPHVPHQVHSQVPANHAVYHNNIHNNMSGSSLNNAEQKPSNHQMDTTGHIHNQQYQVHELPPKPTHSLHQPRNA